MHRLFVALRPPRFIRETLLATMGGVPGARWQSDEQLHITMRFVGEVDRHMANDLAAALGGVRHPPVTVALAGVGRFERRGVADTLWAGLTGTDGLHSLHQKVDQAVFRAGLPHDGRAFLPHITLARFARRSGADLSPFLDRHAGLASTPFAMEHMLLFESHLGSAGATYHAVERYPLG